MLKLKKVQILGFKSFCDRTEIHLSGGGIAAVVGPNGCGKSNISDAMTWVLGEQSAKSLRGTKMEDVIFAGTRERKPTGMAEVSLTLVDPEVYDGAALGDEAGRGRLVQRRQQRDANSIWPATGMRRNCGRCRPQKRKKRWREAQPGVVHRDRWERRWRVEEHARCTRRPAPSETAADGGAATRMASC